MSWERGREVHCCSLLWPQGCLLSRLSGRGSPQPAAAPSCTPTRSTRGHCLEASPAPALTARSQCLDKWVLEPPFKHPRTDLKIRFPVSLNKSGFGMLSLGAPVTPQVCLLLGLAGPASPACSGTDPGCGTQGEATPLLKYRMRPPSGGSTSHTTLSHSLGPCSERVSICLKTHSPGAGPTGRPGVASGQGCAHHSPHGLGPRGHSSGLSQR